MSVNYINIEDYYLLQKKNIRERSIKYLIIILLPIILLLVISYNNYYSKYYLNLGLVNNKNNLTINVNSEDLSIITNNTKIIINNKVYEYKIKEIKEQILYQNNTIFQEIVLDINLDESINYKNYNTKIKILVERTKLINLVLGLIKGGKND